MHPDTVYIYRDILPTIDGMLFSTAVLIFVLALWLVVMFAWWRSDTLRYRQQVRRWGDEP